MSALSGTAHGADPVLDRFAQVDFELLTDPKRTPKTHPTDQRVAKYLTLDFPIEF